MYKLCFILGLVVYSLAYDNLALKKPAYQQFPYKVSDKIPISLIQASNAVDGLKSNLSIWGGQCVTSEVKQQTATWWVNLTSVLSIHHITIYYRTEHVAWGPSSGFTKRFLGFSLYISNTTDRFQGTLCFKDTEFTANTIPPNITRDCPYHGQYVIYYNERLIGKPYPTGYSNYSYNELCEVEVYGCSAPRHFGPNCSTPCPDSRCRYCHIESGACQGCDPGYQGHRCENECDYGFYGEKCEHTCPDNCDGCDNVNGLCDSGCHPGWKGQTCEQQCDYGFYGEKCEHTCPDNCDGCDNVNGLCNRGCKPGWKEQNCEKQCDSGKYGDQCKEFCGHCQEQRPCFHTNGTCLTGCGAGYLGEFCKIECKDGFYGDDCLKKCGNCEDLIQCNHVNGMCSSGCKPGYKGDKCMQSCDGLMFGKNCSEHCGTCLYHEQCHHINGTCMNGCDRGFQGSNCTKECENDYFGFNCEEMCNSTCISCNKTTGICENGCRAGWRGIYCEKECKAEYYGENCRRKCGHCLNETCHHIHGNCSRGCDPGFQAPFCTQECIEGKYGLNCEEDCGNCTDVKQCFHVDGICLTGCISGYQKPLCKAIISKRTTAPDNGSLPIIGAVVGVLLLFVIIIVVVFIIRRRAKAPSIEKYITPSHGSTEETENQYSNVKKTPQASSRKPENKHDNNGKTVQLSSDNDEDTAANTHQDADEDNVYMNETIKKPILVEKLESVITEKRAKGDEGFRKEYAALPSGEVHTCYVGKKSENVQKNRFKTTFPYDHSRVVLSVTNEETSDYINANYIQGLNRTKEYIAAQGPKQNTLRDFWRMVWQEDVNTIVMLTNLKEGDKIKCTKYWPDKNETSTFGPLSIRLIEDKKYAFFIERKLSISNTALNKTRVVTQYHYIAWPDHGTPEPISLLDFHHHVITTANKKTVPTLVHCSAGVGRTGTYIALDALYQEGKNTGKVDVAEFVKKMRDNRVSMVQTYEQYITIFLALNEIFKAPIQRYSSGDFCTKAEHASRDNPANRNPLRKEFQLLLKVKQPKTEADYKLARQKSAGRTTDKVLPLDKYSLHLSSTISNRGNYINAITVPSFTKARRFIVTQYPTPEDAVDFLRLLSDHESDTVICLDPVHDVQSIQSWLPQLSSSKVIAPFTIHCQTNSRNGIPGHVIHILQDKQEDEAHSVLVVEPRKKITPHSNPLDTSELLRLVSNVLYSETETPVTVVSSDGASICGLFIAVHNVIQQLNMDCGVDVFTAVRQLQIRRPEFFGSFEEYEMIHRAVLDHIQTTSENIYCNQ